MCTAHFGINSIIYEPKTAWGFKHLQPQLSVHAEADGLSSIPVDLCTVIECHVRPCQNQLHKVKGHPAEPNYYYAASSCNCCQCAVCHGSMCRALQYQGCASGLKVAASASTLAGAGRGHIRSACKWVMMNEQCQRFTITVCKPGLLLCSRCG